MAGNESIQDELIKYGVRLDRFNANTTQQVNFVLNELQNDLRGEIVEKDIPGTIPSRQVERSVALFRDVNRMIDDSYEIIVDINDGALQDVSVLANAEAAKAINVGLTVNLATPVLTPNELRILTKDPIIRGRPTSEWWAGQEESLQNRFAQEMRLGIAQGETNDQLVQRIIGKQQPGRFIEVTDPVTGKRSKVPRLTGGIMDVSRREAEALVRTSAQTVSNDVLFESYKANSDILRGVAALVTLDNHTTNICISRSGGIWNPVTGEPLPESTRQEPMPPPPPWHWNCRTIYMPVTKSWDELRNSKGKDALPAEDKKKLDTVPRRTRRTIDGTLPGDVTFDEFLKDRTQAFQIDTLGPGRWKLWNDGKIELNQLTDFSGRPLTLVELNALPDN